MNVLGDIFNYGGNVEDQEYYGFTAPFFKISHNLIDDITKKKWMDMQLGNLIYQRDMENIDKYYDERNWIDLIDNK